MCGARIGCIVSKELMATAMKFAQVLKPTNICTSSCEAALDTPQSFDEVISEYRERRDTLVAELEKIEGVKVANQKTFTA
jgi:aspartate aminotransferase